MRPIYVLSKQKGGRLQLALLGDTCMTSVLGGDNRQADDSTNKLREYDSDKGEGGQEIQKFCARH